MNENAAFGWSALTPTRWLRVILCLTNQRVRVNALHLAAIF